MAHIQLELITVEGRLGVDFDVRSLLLAGYSGRDWEAVRKHIEELKKIGIAAPEKTPILYKVSPELITNEEEIIVNSAETSGEIEYVLLIANKGLWVTVGSDHTDRKIEKTDVTRAKKACQKVIARDAWPYDEIGNHWDDITMKAFVMKDGVKTVYQEGSLGTLLSAENLLDIFDVRKEGNVLFSGTIPLKEKLIYADEFEMEIYDPRMKRKISHKYKVKRLGES